MRMIDADKLCPDCLTKQGKLAISQSQIANAPTVRLFISGGQVVPDMLQGWKYEERPKDEWIVVSNGTTNHYACSKCGHAGDFQDKFCRECGADMRKEVQNETNRC